MPSLREAIQESVGESHQANSCRASGLGKRNTFAALVPIPVLLPHWDPSEALRKHWRPVHYLGQSQTRQIWTREDRRILGAHLSSSSVASSLCILAEATLSGGPNPPPVPSSSASLMNWLLQHQLPSRASWNHKAVFCALQRILAWCLRAALCVPAALMWAGAQDHYHSSPWCPLCSEQVLHRAPLPRHPWWEHI